MSIFEKIKNEVDLEKKLVPEEVITEPDKDSFRSSSFYRVDGNKKIHHDVFYHLAKICSSCGLLDRITPDDSFIEANRKFRMAYQLRFMEDNCPANSIEHSIFRKLMSDAINENKKILTIPNKQLFINWPDNMFPILTLKYENFEAMLRDMISATNYINEKLKEKRS